MSQSMSQLEIAPYAISGQCCRVVFSVVFLLQLRRTESSVGTVTTSSQGPRR